MPITRGAGVSVSFGQCPGCRDDYVLTVDYLDAAFTLRPALQGTGVAVTDRTPFFDLTLPCGGILTVIWSGGVGVITAWRC
jgi:hypothetical protein